MFGLAAGLNGFKTSDGGIHLVGDTSGVTFQILACSHGCNVPLRHAVSQVILHTLCGESGCAHIEITIYANGKFASAREVWITWTWDDKEREPLVETRMPSRFLNTLPNGEYVLDTPWGLKPVTTDRSHAANLENVVYLPREHCGLLLRRATNLNDHNLLLHLLSKAEEVKCAETRLEQLERELAEQREQLARARENSKRLTTLLRAYAPDLNVDLIVGDNHCLHNWREVTLPYHLSEAALRNDIIAACNSAAPRTVLGWLVRFSWDRFLCRLAGIPVSSGLKWIIFDSKK